MEKVTYEIGDDLIETSRIVYVEDAPDVDPGNSLNIRSQRRGRSAMTLRGFFSPIEIFQPAN